VAETPVESNGRVFRLGVSRPSPTLVDPPSFVVRQEGKPALGIGVVTTRAPTFGARQDVADATAES